MPAILYLIPTPLGTPDTPCLLPHEQQQIVGLTDFVVEAEKTARAHLFFDPAYKTPVSEDKVPNKSHLLRDKDGKPFVYPYFIHDSYDSSDAVNKFNWTKATDSKAYPKNVKSRNHRRSEERRVGKECRSRWSPYH